MAKRFGTGKPIPIEKFKERIAESRKLSNELWEARDSETMTRDELIDLLYERDVKQLIDNVHCNDIWDYMRDSFVKGMKGYNDYSSLELIKMARRGLNRKINLVD